MPTKSNDSTGTNSAEQSIERIQPVASQVGGWLGAAEGRLLFSLAQRADPQTRIVEIGSWKGKSTIWLAAGAKAGRGARVAAIDPHFGSYAHAPGQNTELELRQNLERAGVADQVDVTVATSEEAAAQWRHPVSVLWIDGDHSYEGAKHDLLLWQDHVIDGGVIAFHDTFIDYGPERVVSEFLIGSRHFSDFGFTTTISYATKRDKAVTGQALSKRLWVLRRNMHGLRLRAGLPASLYFYLKSFKKKQGVPKQVFTALKSLRDFSGLRKA